MFWEARRNAELKFANENCSLLAKSEQANWDLREQAPVGEPKTLPLVYIVVNLVK